MSKFLRHFGLFCTIALIAVSASAQNASTISGTVKNSTTSETLAAVTVSLKGTSAGTFTSDKGTFRLPVTVDAPYTLVFSSVGFETKEVKVNSNTSSVEVSLKPAFVLGADVVVAASRVPERILESPVTIERIGSLAIKTAPATNYYDILSNLKGVDVTAASLTFKSISTRGFNGSGNTRMNQLIDGMDNQAPGLNFSVGSVIGLTELDVDNIELLSGASSALYGSGGMNGTVLINSKSPFKYQGLSFQIKQGVNHVDNYQRPQAAYKDYTVRFAQVLEDRLAYKIGVQYTEAQDWLANNTGNYSRTSGTQNGQTIGGTRYNDPNFDGVNIYGDETTSSLSSVFSSVKTGVLGALTSAYGGSSAAGNAAYNQLFGAAQAGPYAGSLTAYSTFLKAANPALAPYAPYLYGEAKGMFTGVNVSRTGYKEADVIDPTTKNVKFTGAIHYKLTDDVEVIAAAYTGQGNTVYTGSDRYSLKDLQMSQFKLEFKAKDWYFRAYKTVENSGNSFNATIASRYFNEVVSPSTTWYPTYTAAYASALAAGASQQIAHETARNLADAGRPVGSIASDARFQKIVSTPISQGGAKFLDKSVLNVVEGQYNLTTLTGLDKYDAELLVGGSVKQYVLNSQGTLFADTVTNIWINEIGSYAQLSKKFFGDVMKLSVSGRYDKSDFFKGRFTPRVSAVFKVAEDNNLRVSYQSAYRFPTTQNQWINLLVGGGTRLMGGVQQLQDYYQFNTNKVYTLASVQAFGAQAALGNVNPNLLQQQVFGKFKPESMNSFEVGYKTLIAKKLLIDAYVYTGKYTNFISGVTVLQSNQTVPSIADLLDAKKRTAYSISTNAAGDVSTSGWGVSADYLLPRNFSVTANVYSDKIGDLPTGFISYFNTPKLRANFAINNSGFLLKNKLGFSANMHYQEGFTYEGTFAVGSVAAFHTIDAVLTYKLPQIKSLIKLGGTNIFNKYYYTAFGSPAIGGLYYVSFAYNIM